MKTALNALVQVMLNARHAKMDIFVNMEHVPNAMKLARLALELIHIIIAHLAMMDFIDQVIGHAWHVQKDAINALAWIIVTNVKMDTT